MSGEDIFKELGGIDDRFVLSAAPGEKIKRKNPRRLILTAAACLIVIFCVVFPVVLKKINEPKAPDFGRVIWLENMMTGTVDSDEQYEDYVFAFLVIAKNGDPGSVISMKRKFLDNGIYACIVKEKLVIFATNRQLRELKISEKENLRFSNAPYSLFEDK